MPRVSGNCGRQGISPADEWLSAAQLCSELGVSEATIVEWLERIPHFQLAPGLIRFRRHEAEPLLARLRGSGLPRTGRALVALLGVSVTARAVQLLMALADVVA